MRKDRVNRRGLISKVRRLGRKNLGRLAACGTAGFGLTINAAATTLITFDGFSVNNNSIGSLPDYGDNVTANSADYTISAGLTGIAGTPDLTLDWLGQWDTYTNWDGIRGSVAQSDFNGGPTVSIMFTPSAVSAVRVASFVLDEWSAGGAGSITWEVLRPNGDTLRTGTFTMTDTGGRSLISPNVTGVIGESLTLNLTLNSGAPSYFALDNLTFDQVPEPSSVATLSAVAFGAAVMRRRRRG